MHFRPIFYVTGLMTAGLGFFMLPCALADILMSQPDADLVYSGWRIFLLLSIVCVTTGSALAIVSRQRDEPIRRHDALVLTVLSWAVLTAIAALPFFLGFSFSLTDAMFESMSGLTTTGATIMTNIESFPPSLILWRAMLQWFGGVGIIVTAIAILPSLKIGGMQLFHLESSDTSDKYMPRIAEIATQTAIVYLTLTLLCAAAYRLTGMTEFEAVSMSLTTVATGGFAGTDASFAPYVPLGADIVAMVFMVICSLPFGLMVMTLHGDWKAFGRDPQPIVWLGILIVAILLMWAYISGRPGVDIGEEGALRMAAFNVTSILSGTGYGTTDFSVWGPFASALFVILMFLGGTAGSASCGIKTFRVHIAFLAVFAYARSMIRPHQISPVRYAGKPVKAETLQSIMLFMFLFLASYGLLAALLALTGLDATTAISAAAATLCNVGPGLGGIGPENNFADLTGIAKWLCIAAMLLGRLELISVFVILSPGFWRN